MAVLNLGSAQENASSTMDNGTTGIEIVSQNNNQGSAFVDTNALSSDELKDPNKIQVTIADTKSPLVILFGPPSCGKTMTLIRLTRYLRREGYTVHPVRSFRPAYDENYKKMCDGYDSMVNSQYAPGSTGKINFMLVEVLKNGRSLCQILEGPGEYYFNPQYPQADFPAYVKQIMFSQNRKIWAIMVEPDSTNAQMDETARNNYVSKIGELKKGVSPHDKFIFVLNKIDQTDFLTAQGRTQDGYAMREINNLYPGIFDIFKNENPITRLFKQYNFDFLSFHTGGFTVDTENKQTFQAGPEIYPRRLWDVMYKRIHG